MKQFIILVALATLAVNGLPANASDTNYSPSEEEAASVRSAAEHGDAEEQWRLGEIYQNGTAGVGQNYGQAAKWYREAAQKGNDKAAAELGFLYTQGKGVKQSYTEAAKWYLKAAEKGNAGAEYDLGCLYQDGNGVLQNYLEAAKWFREAAEQGLVEAQENLGNLYTQGWGVPKDYVEAYMWFSVAMTAGSMKAKPTLDWIEKRMTANQITEAKRRAKGWRHKSES